jgi:hypothetical protein
MFRACTGRIQELLFPIVTNNSSGRTLDLFLTPIRIIQFLLDYHYKLIQIIINFSFFLYINVDYDGF